MLLPAARAAALSIPSGVETTISNCTSPCWNLSVSSWVALADSDVGSWNPLADRVFATGTPNIPNATVSNTAKPMTRRGAAMASRAIRCSRSGPPLNPFVMRHEAHRLVVQSIADAARFSSTYGGICVPSSVWLACSFLEPSYFAAHQLRVVLPDDRVKRTTNAGTRFIAARRDGRKGLE
jgi:hypothetical protein